MQYLPFIKIIIEGNNLKIKKNHIIKVLNHLKETYFVAQYAFFIFAIISNLLSIIIFRKNLNKIEKKNIKSFFYTLKNTLPFFNKVNELVLAIYFIHFENKEKIKLKKYKNIKNKKFYDVVIVGSGPAGSLSSYYLQKKKVDTLLIEEGDYYEIPKTKHPGDEFQYKWRNGGINTTIFPYQINFGSGKCFGGGSEINSGLYHFPNKKFVNASKKKYKIKRFSYKELKNLNKNILEKLNLTKQKKTISEKLFINSFEKQKIKTEKIPVLYSRNNFKSSMTNTFLKEYLKMRGKVKNAKVKKIKYTYDNTWELNLIQKNKMIKIYCKNLILAAGSIETQKILYRSNLISNHYMNFKLHPMFKVLIKSKKIIQKKNLNVHSSQVTRFYPNFIIGEAASSKQFQLLNFLGNNNLMNTVHKQWRQISIIHSTFSFGLGKIYKIPFIDKFIYTYRIDKQNLYFLKKALTTIFKVFLTNNNCEILIPFRNGYLINKKNYKDFLKKITSFKNLPFSSVHILGGITFGECDKCYADSYGKVKNYKNLYINDSSLINEKLLQNPQGTVMILAYRNIKNFYNKLENKITYQKYQAKKIR
jgi:hypothetical protein